MLHTVDKIEAPLVLLKEYSIVCCSLISTIHRVKLEVYFAFAFPGTAMSLVVASAPDAVAPRLAWLLPPSTTSSPCVGRTPQRGLP
jgi:hypothetical protein